MGGIDAALAEASQTRKSIRALDLDMVDVEGAVLMWLFDVVKVLSTCCVSFFLFFLLFFPSSLLRVSIEN